MFQNEVNPNMGYAIDWGTGQLPGGGFSTSGFSSGGEDDFLDDGGTEDASKFYVDAPISDGTYILILMIFAYATSKRFTKKRKIKKLI